MWSPLPCRLPNWLSFHIWKKSLIKRLPGAAAHKKVLFRNPHSSGSAASCTIWNRGALLSSPKSFYVGDQRIEKKKAILPNSRVGSSVSALLWKTLPSSVAIMFGLKDSPYLAIPNPHYDDADTDVDDVYDEPIVMMTTMMLMWRGYVGYAALISWNANWPLAPTKSHINLGQPDEGRHPSKQNVFRLQ